MRCVTVWLKERSPEVSLARRRRGERRLHRLLVGTCGFEEEPAAALGLIDPVFEKAGGGDVFSIVAEGVYGAHAEGQGLLVFVQLAEHVLGGDVVGIVVG